MSYTVSVEQSIVYEFVVSLIAFTEKRTHSTLDLGTAWIKNLKKELPSDFSPKLAAVQKLSPGFPIILALQSPAKSPREFIQWLEKLSWSEIYETTLWSKGDVILSQPQTIERWRELMCPVLHIWYEQYFCKAEERIGSLLSEDISDIKLDSPPHELVEHLSNGIQLDAMPEISHVYLVPQYHYRPWNLYDIGHKELILAYPCRLELLTGETPSSLLRLTKALADENRLRILQMLTESPHTFTEIAGKMSIVKSTVHHHLMTLRAAGLVWVHLSSTRNERFSLRMEAIEGIQGKLAKYLRGALK